MILPEQPNQPPRVGRQAGVLAVRAAARGPAELLLISARASFDRWTIPKGWIEPGEPPAAAASREALEEGGVSGVLVNGPIGRCHRRSAGMSVLMDIFVLRVDRVDDTWPEQGARQRLWLPPADAARHLHHTELAELVDRLVVRLERRWPEG